MQRNLPVRRVDDCRGTPRVVQLHTVFLEIFVRTADIAVRETPVAVQVGSAVRGSRRIERSGGLQGTPVEHCGHVIGTDRLGDPILGEGG